MALLQTVELTRTSVDVKLFGVSDEGKPFNETFNKIQKKYIDSGQLISKAQNKTSDQLTFSYAFLWKSKEDFEAYVNEEELKGTGGNASIWVVDHDHITNSFRGHICHNCNRGLGVFQDDVNRLERAIRYLSLI